MLADHGISIANSETGHLRCNASLISEQSERRYLHVRAC
jgi:hypothetical protein